MNKYGIYLISDPQYDIDTIEEVLKTGKIKYLQYRNKVATDSEFITEGQQYKKLCEKYQVKLIVNDRVHLVSIIGADGIHVGQQDPNGMECKMLHPELIVGVSVTSIQEAKQAVIDGADYIGVGAMFPTATKEDAKIVSQNTLIDIYEQCDIDIVTIGGITIDNGSQLIPYCDGLAICSNILAASQPAELTYKFDSLINC